MSEVRKVGFKRTRRGTFKVRLRDRFKARLRWGFKHWLRVVRDWKHGRLRCIVLGHEHPPPATPGVVWSALLESRERSPEAFYLDDAFLDDTFDDVHGEWPGDLKYWRWDEGRGGSDAAT